MGVGVVLEPLVVIVLLFGGTWINCRRTFTSHRCHTRRSSDSSRGASPDFAEPRNSSPTPKDRLLSPRCRSPPWEDPDDRRRTRQIGILGARWEVKTPNTAVFQGRLLSRLFWRLPFLVECWYWALVYWTYQLGRALTAVTLKEGTVDVARKHALQLIKLEQQLGVFCEIEIQQFFLRHPLLMTGLNWTYSFIHIPGTIAFLVWLYYYTTILHQIDDSLPTKFGVAVTASPAGPLLYQARRRTLAVCNLLAFVVFTLWPCMPPRLLSDQRVEGPEGELARRYGFIDTVHGTNGAGSVWTENRFCNQYAAMPSLHFGYSLLLGLTVMTIPLSPHPQPRLARVLRLHLPWRRLVCLVLGFLYPFVILVAIVATANHFILDAVAGAVVCAVGWWCNSVLLNLLPLEDYFLWVVRIHKPETVSAIDGLDARDAEEASAYAVLPG